MASLEKTTTNALSWSALERILNQGLNFAIQILLSRLVDPTEFGLLTLLTVFVIFSNVIIESGLSQAIIQKKEVSRTDISTVFVFNLAGALFLYLVLFFSAPFVANYYEESRLTILLRVVALSIVVKALGAIHLSLLVRNLEFKKLFRITTPALVVGGTVGITLAILDFEVWAIVAFQLVTAIVATTCYWLMSNQDRRPHLRFSFGSFKTLWKFGLGIFGANLSFHATQNLYSLVIGKAFNFGQLGYYDRARMFHRTPMTFFSSIFNRVLFPVFSTIQNDNARIVSALRSGIPIIAFTVFPLMAFLMFAADNIVVFLLTEKWLPSARLVRWFPIIGMGWPLAAVLMSVLRGKGKAGLYFWLTMLKNATAIGLLILAIPHGVLAIVIGQVIAALIGFVANSIACRQAVGYQFIEQVCDIIPYVILVGATAAASTLLLVFVNLNSNFLELLLKVFVFFTIYFFLAWMAQLNGLEKAVSMFRSGRQSLSKAFSR